MCNPVAEVSAHYIISEAGKVVNLVPEDMRAWHAGAGAWGDITDVNSCSIGIELNNTGAAPFAAPLMDALEPLLAQMMDRWAIPAHRVIAHSDLAPGRKIDPGARFDWRRLALGGFGVWPQPPSGDPADFTAMMQRFGYTATDDADLLLSGFRLRFVPRPPVLAAQRRRRVRRCVGSFAPSTGKNGVLRRRDVDWVEEQVGLYHGGPPLLNMTRRVRLLTNHTIQLIIPKCLRHRMQRSCQARSRRD